MFDSVVVGQSPRQRDRRDDESVLPLIAEQSLALPPIRGPAWVQPPSQWLQGPVRVSPGLRTAVEQPTWSLSCAGGPTFGITPLKRAWHSRLNESPAARRRAATSVPCMPAASAR